MLEFPFKNQLRILDPIPCAYPPGGRLRKPVHAVIFDIYGTLFISGSGDVGTAEEGLNGVSSLKDLCRSFDIDTPPGQLSKRLLDAIRRIHQQQRSKGIPFPEIEIDVVWQNILEWADMDRVREFALAYEWRVNPTYPMPGLDETLRTIQHRGLMMGIISNAQFFTPLLFRWFLGRFPNKIGFEDELTFYSYRFGEAKPSSALFKRCARNLVERGIAPESVAYIGNDMLNDMMPAKEIGWQTVLFAGDLRSLRLREDRPECQRFIPDLVVTDLRQLLEWC